jgi:transcriptional regulator with XRE-family HTH domain
LREKIGARLRQERERLGFTQAEFAALGNVSTRSQTDWEMGKAVPNAEFLASVAAHGLDVSYVVTGVRNVAVLPDDDATFLAGFRALDGRGKDVVLAILMAMDLGTRVEPWGLCREMRLVKSYRAASPEQREVLDVFIKSIEDDGNDAALDGPPDT